MTKEKDANVHKKTHLIIIIIINRNATQADSYIVFLTIYLDNELKLEKLVCRL